MKDYKILTRVLKKCYLFKSWQNQQIYVNTFDYWVLIFFPSSIIFLKVWPVLSGVGMMYIQVKKKDASCNLIGYI